MESTPILYINLERSPNRRVRMEGEFAEYGISNFTRIDAFDGKKLFNTPGMLASTVEIPPDLKQSPGEIGCALSHIRAAAAGAAMGVPYVLVMEDDIHLTFYKNWKTTIAEIVAQAPADWTVLQLTINNVRVMRTLLGLGSAFVPWRKNHWSTGAYLINAAGCQRCVREYCNGPEAAATYKLPGGGVQLVSDVLMFNGTGAYTHTRPLFDHEINESTIHQSHVESVHRQAAELGSHFYGRMDLVWCGGDDSRCAVFCTLEDAALKDQRARLEWWVQFHLRAGFRWLILYVHDDTVAEELRKCFNWLGQCLVVVRTDGDVASDAVGRARLAGASWLLRLADDELFYVLPGRSLRSVFDEARRWSGQPRSPGGSEEQQQVYSLRFDNLEVQKKKQKKKKNGNNNFFETETLFKRRTERCDGSPVSATDDRAYFYDVQPTAAQLRRLPKKQSSSSGEPLSPTTNNANNNFYLGSNKGRAAARLAEPGLQEQDHCTSWSASRKDGPKELLSSRAFVLSFPYCHFENWKTRFSSSANRAQQRLQLQQHKTGSDDPRLLLRRGADPGSSSKKSTSKRAASSSRVVVSTAEDSLTAFEVASVEVLLAKDDSAARDFYAKHVALPPRKQVEEEDDDDDVASVVQVALPAGCVRADCGGAYARVRGRSGDDASALYQQQGGAHHLYRISTPFVAWMVGRTPYSSTAALVAHDLALRPQDVRAPWSAFDGRRWATLSGAYVRLDQQVLAESRLAVVCASSVLETPVDTLRALMLAPPRLEPEELVRATEAPPFATAPAKDISGRRDEPSWEARDTRKKKSKEQSSMLLGTFLTAELAEAALSVATKRSQRESYLLKVRDSGAVLVDLPATCGAAADACVGVYVPHEPPKPKPGVTPTTCGGRVFRHEEGAHYLYFYEPFSAWMIGSRPGSGSAALIAYDAAERPELIADDAPWRVYDGRAWREVYDVKIRALVNTDDKNNNPCGAKSTALPLLKSSSSNNDNATATAATEKEKDKMSFDKIEISKDMQALIACSLDELPSYPWSPQPCDVADEEAAPGGDFDEESYGPSTQKTPFVTGRKYLVYTCAGDKAVIPCWLKNGHRDFDLWVTYYGKQDDDLWRQQADVYRRRRGGKFENLQALCKEAGMVDADGKLVMDRYDGVLVMDDDVVIDAPRINRLFQIREQLDLDAIQPSFERRGKVSHCITAVQPANRVRLTNFLEMTCPLFKTRPLMKFLERLDPALKGWGADWWFLSIIAQQEDAQIDPRVGLKGRIGVCDAVSCINPTDDDKGGTREINVLQGREDRKTSWEFIRKRENVGEWGHLEFATVCLSNEALDEYQKPTEPLRIRGCRNYELLYDATEPRLLLPPTPIVEVEEQETGDPNDETVGSDASGGTAVGPAEQQEDEIIAAPQRLDAKDIDAVEDTTTNNVETSSVTSRLIDEENLPAPVPAADGADDDAKMIEPPCSSEEEERVQQQPL